MPYALLLFVAMPIVEIAVLLRVGSALGWLPTLGIVILTAFLGAAMLRQQGLATLNKARARMGAGEMPAQQLIEGVLLLLGGVLLLTPGFVTDAFGFACLIPASRIWLATRISQRTRVSVAMGSTEPFGQDHAGNPDAGSGRHPSGSQTTGRQAPGAATSTDAKNSAKSGDVIDGDFTRID